MASGSFCEITEKLITQWEGGLLSDEEKKELCAHIADCLSCRRRFGKLVPLIEETGLEEIVGFTGLHGKSGADFEDRIMERIEAESGECGMVRPRKSSRFLTIAAAAAAAVVLIFTVVRFTAHQTDGTEEVLVRFSLSAPFRLRPSLLRATLPGGMKTA